MAVAIGKEIADEISPHCYDGYYQGQGYKLRYPVGNNLNNDNTESYVTHTKCAVLRNLSELEATLSVEFKQPPGGSIDTETLFHRRPPREDDDPMERLRDGGAWLVHGVGEAAASQGRQWRPLPCA